MNKLVQTWDIGKRSLPSLARGSSLQRAFIHLSFLFFCFSLSLQLGKASYPFLHTFLLHVSYISFSYTLTFLLYKIIWLNIAEIFCVRLLSLDVCGRCICPRIKHQIEISTLRRRKHNFSQSKHHHHRTFKNGELVVDRHHKLASSKM
jgi:hypothetical protein